MILLPIQAYTGPGTIPHLKPCEILVVTEGGGHLGYQGKLVVLQDGSVSVTRSMREKPQAATRFRLNRTEFVRLKRQIAATDFDALHQAPSAKHAPSAVDGIDRGRAVRKAPGARGWSNVRWQLPSEPVPLFETIDALLARARDR